MVTSIYKIGSKVLFLLVFFNNIFERKSSPTYRIDRLSSTSQMNGFLIILLSSTVFASSAVDNSTTDHSNEKIKAAEIIRDLLSPSYDRRVRPPNEDEQGISRPVEVDVNIYLRSMSNIDFVKMEYSLQITLRQEWRDSRLAYQDRGKIVPNYIIITRNDLIWIPDTFFMNEKQAHRHLIDTPNMLFRIYPDGKVLYSERISLVLSCPMFLQKYPMDKQSCEMRMASYAYTTDDIVYKWKDVNPIQYHSLLGSSLPSYLLANTENVTCSSKTNTGEYSCIGTVFHLERQFSYYLVLIYIPSTLLVIVSWVSFWLDRTAVPARVTLGVTTLLTMTTQAAAIQSGLPPVAYVKAVDIWIGCCLLFIFSAVLEFAWVSLEASSIELREKRRRDCLEHTKSNPMSPMMDEDHLLLVNKANGEAKKKNLQPGFWDTWTYGADESKMIDLKARIVFPLLFVLFQVCYWAWYYFML